MERLVFNDVHVHVSTFSKTHETYRKFMNLNADFKENWKLIESSPDYLIERMDKEGVSKMVLINYVAQDVIGYDLSVNEFVSNYCKDRRDRLIPFGGVDLKLEVPEFVKNVEYSYSKLEISGFKVHPPHQLIYPNQYKEEFGSLKLPHLEKLYEFATDHRIPIMFHTGTSMFPKAGIKYGDPIYLDDVMNDFPRLRVLIAHGGRPFTFWTETTFFLLRRHDNLYLDISGIPPSRLLDYFPRITEISKKVIFGSDWPSPGVKGLRANAMEILKLQLPDDIKTAILRTNFESFFGHSK